MSIKTIKVQKVPDGKLVRIGIENDNGINISTLERLFPNIQLLGYFNQDGELFSMEFHNGKIYPLNGEEWEYEITHVPIYADAPTSSSETRSNNVGPNSCIAGIIAVMWRLIQLLILFYGIVYLKSGRGYQYKDTSIISSTILKVKGIGYKQTGQNETLVIDGADYIVPPQENNALFLMTNFIRTDQEHKRCPESPYEKEAACRNDAHCEANRDFLKANGKWTGRCLLKNNSSIDSSRSIMGLCELEGWCPVENDRHIPNPIYDALNFTIFIKNVIEFPRFRVIRKNIALDASYLKKCNFHEINHPSCPIFRVGDILDIVEHDPTEQYLMLKLGGVIRVKIDWNCNLDKPLSHCQPEYSFRRLDTLFKEEPFLQGFNFRFASHWKYQNRSYRTLTKAFGLRFIVSVSGQVRRFDVITLTFTIVHFILLLALPTFICNCKRH